MKFLPTAQVIEKYGISLSWLYWAKRLAGVRPKQEIVNGRARNLFSEADLEKIIRLKRKGSA